MRENEKAPPSEEAEFSRYRAIRNRGFTNMFPEDVSFYRWFTERLLWSLITEIGANNLSGGEIYERLNFIFDWVEKIDPAFLEFTYQDQVTFAIEMLGILKNQIKAINAENWIIDETQKKVSDILH